MPKEKEEDSELEEIIEEEELEDVAEEVRENSLQDFDDNALLKFLAESESVSPSLERVAVAQDEVRLERVADEAPKKEEPTRKKDYSIDNSYELDNNYSDSKKEYESDLQEVKFETLGNEDDSRGLQEMKSDSRNEYTAPKSLEREQSSGAQKYHSRKSI